MYKKIISLIAVSALFFGATVMAHTIAKKGMKADLVLMPKFLGILVFDQANDGAQEAHRELGNPGKLEFLGPTPENSVAGQIEILTTATTQGQDGIMISNNAGDQIAPAAKAARAKGMTVVTWDSPIPSADGEQLFIAQVDFNETGMVMAITIPVSLKSTCAMKSCSPSAEGMGESHVTTVIPFALAALAAGAI